MRNANKTHIAV